MFGADGVSSISLTSNASGSFVSIVADAIIGSTVDDAASPLTGIVGGNLEVPSGGSAIPGKLVTPPNPFSTPPPPLLQPPPPLTITAPTVPTTANPLGPTTTTTPATPTGATPTYPTPPALPAAPAVTAPAAPDVTAPAAPDVTAPAAPAVTAPAAPVVTATATPVVTATTRGKGWTGRWSRQARPPEARLDHPFGGSTSRWVSTLRPAGGLDKLDHPRQGWTTRLGARPAGGSRPFARPVVSTSSTGRGKLDRPPVVSTSSTSRGKARPPEAGLDRPTQGSTGRLPGDPTRTPVR